MRRWALRELLPWAIKEWRVALYLFNEESHTTKVSLAQKMGLFKLGNSHLASQEREASVLRTHTHHSPRNLQKYFPVPCLWDRSLLSGISVLRSHREPPLLFYQMGVWWDGTIYELASRSLPEWNLPVPWTWNSQSPDLGESISVVSTPFNPWHSAKAAWTDLGKHKQQELYVCNIFFDKNLES